MPRLLLKTLRNLFQEAKKSSYFTKKVKILQKSQKNIRIGINLTLETLYSLLKMRLIKLRKRFKTRPGQTRTYVLESRLCISC